MECSVWLHPMNFNKDGDFMISWTWQPMLKQIWDSSSDNSDGSLWTLCNYPTGMWPIARPALYRDISGQTVCQDMSRLLMMEMDLVSETLVCLIHLMWLWAPEDFIEWSILGSHVVYAVAVSIASLQQQCCGIKLYKIFTTENLICICFSLDCKPNSRKWFRVQWNRWCTYTGGSSWRRNYKKHQKRSWKS